MRKLFGTDGVRGLANKYPITANIALKLGKAAALVLSNSTKKPKFLIGKDTRLSGYMLEYALTSGLVSMGADVFLVGPMPTPAIAHLTRSFGADAGIVISASHNPAADNGIKFFDNKGFKLPDEVEEKIEEYVFSDVEKLHASPHKVGTAYRIDDARGRYIEFAKGSVNNISLKGLKIALDCANGAAYKVAPLIFSELGAELVILNNQPDGLNINHECGALHPEVVQAAVLGHHTDIGISLDGDADRLIVVDDKGTILDGDTIMCICALELLKQNRLKNNTLVVTQYTNLAVDALLSKHNAKTVRVQNGDRYVIEEMRKSGYNFGGEQSGHLIFSDYNSTGDGTIAALQLLRVIKEGKKKLSQLSSIIERYPQVIVNVRVKEKREISKMPAVKAAITQGEAALGKEGRLLIRYSGTENALRIMAEGKEKDNIARIANNIAALVIKEVGA